MKKHFWYAIVLFLCMSVKLLAQQFPNSNCEDWSAATFDGKAQPAFWHYSNVTQLTFKFNFANKETGHNGGSCMMVQDQALEVAGIGETGPGYIAIGEPWVYLESLGKVDQATAGTVGGTAWTYRPDTMEVWIKRTGSDAMKEDFHLLYYAWTGTAYSDKYKGKDGSCTSYNRTDEESDIRLDANPNECGTVTAGHQVCEGWVYGRKIYNSWTQIKVPIYYINNTVPEKVNVIFSAGNYPNFRANDGLYAGNSLYVDDIKLIYSSKIQQLYIGGSEWKGFNPNTEDVQTYVLGDAVNSIPAIKAFRGAGQLTNTRGTTTTYYGRQLQGNEITITPGEIDETPTLITVRAEDGSSETTYKILFAHKASNNASLSGIKVNGTQVSNFSPYVTDYTAEVEYGSTEAPVVTVQKQEDRQTVSFTQPTSLNDVTVIVVTAADGTTTKTYTVHYKEAALSDNTLQDIRVNGISLPDFSPSKTLYTKVSIPLGTTEMPQVEAISKYAPGMQTIVMTPPDVIDGGVYQIAVSTPGNPTPKVYKLTFKLEVSSYCKLKNIYVDGVALTNFSPDNTNYTMSLPMGTSTMPTITWDQGDAYQTVAMEEGGLDGTTRITVTAANGDKMVYKIAFSTAKSSISILNGILLDGTMIAGFDAATTNYQVQLPIGTTQLPQIEATPADPYQQITIISGGMNGITRITVKAGDGSTTIYQISFSVAQATNATLKAIYVGGELIEGFDASVLEYTCILPKGTTELPVVTYTPNDAYQTISTRSGGVNGDYKITVRPQSGSSQTYTIHFSVPKSDNADLQMIYLDGQALSQFQPSTLEYTDTLSSNIIPQVTYTGNDGQKIISYADDNTFTIKVTAENGKTQSYVINFVVRVSESAFLEMIYLNGDSLKGFASNQLTYKNIIIQNGVCPQITALSSEGQQVAILSPAGAGTASIVVTANGGSTNTYTLEMVDTTAVVAPHLDPKQEYTPSDDATLLTILVNGEPLTGFDAKQTDYTIELSAGQAMPVITFVPNTTLQTMIAGQANGTTCQANVTAEDGVHTNIYVVRTKIALYDNALLRDLSVEDHSLDFDPTVMNYHLQLDEGQQLPSLTYETNPGQTVMVHAVNDTTQQIIVMAENGLSHTYTITYTRVMSSNALLKDILINGTSIAHFSPTTYNYVDTLAFRASVVPSVNAIGAVKGQTITTYFSAVKGITRIHVLAEDGRTSADYTIAFPTEPSSNTLLNNITLEAEYAIDELRFDNEQTDYTVVVPFEATKAPSIVFERGEKEQTITYIAGAIGQESKIIVTAENQDTRTYTISIERAAAPKANVLQSIYVAEAEMNIEMKDSTQREFDVVLPYGATQMSVSYIKNYNEQTVLVQPGGLYQPTLLTVLSNNSVQPTTVYTLHPVLTTQNPAVLTGIKIDGTALEDFDSNRLTYIGQRSSAESVPQVQAEYDADKVSVTTHQDIWHWQAVVTQGSNSQTYTIYWHFTKDIIPNGEFEQWTQTAKTSSLKPTGWNATNDYVGDYNAASYVTQASASMVELNCKKHSTLDWAASHYGAAPAIINLASMSALHKVSGGSRTYVSGTVPFYNSPDEAIMNFRLYNIDDDKTGASFIFKFEDSENNPYTYYYMQQSEQSTFETKTLALPLSGKHIHAFDVIVDASSASLYGGKGAQSAKMVVDYVRFGYNNRLAQLLVNEVEASIDGSTITATLENAEQVQLPQLTFVGAVVDQAQKVVWGNTEISGDYSIRNATITNYGEDGNYTTYQLEVKRPIDSNVALTSIQVEGKKLTGFKRDQLNYTYTLPFGTSFFPDIVPVPNSSLQTCTTVITDSVAAITVTAENGAQRTYTIHFVVEDEPNATLLNIAASGLDNFQPEQYDYTIVANEWPEISITKRYDAQVVTMKDGVIDVTAAGGTQQQYRLHLQAPPITTSGQLNELELDGNIVVDFAPDKYLYERSPRPELMNFVRKDATDSVVYIQKPDSLIWQVYGSGKHTYVLTSPATQSSSTNLKGIYANGQLIEGFDAQIKDYRIYCDTAIQLTVEGNNDYQTIVVSLTDKTYTIAVTAQDGTQGIPYQVTLLPTTSSNSQLTAIYLDNILVNGFDPATTQYAIELPTAAYKVHEPLIPHITYTTADPKAAVEVEYGHLGEATSLYVTAPDGTNSTQYQLYFTAEPSHNASLSLIAVNDVPLEHFEPYRHYYSTQIAPVDIRIDWRSMDNFQTVSVDTMSKEQYVVHVMAQDGISQEDYVLDIFTQNLSSDATLASILLDGQLMEDYRSDINQDLTFHPGLNKYNINVPMGITTLPNIAATLKMDGQKIEIRQEDMTIYLDVTAENGINRNTYILQFIGSRSTNTQLKMIYLNGEQMADFQPEQRFYFVNLPQTHSQPDIFIQKAEKAQQLDTASITLSIGTQLTIDVTAEDTNYTNQYVLIMQQEPDNTDTLCMLIADGEDLTDFDAQVFNYHYYIPYAEGQSFPVLSWMAANDYQTIEVDTVEHSKLTLTRQIIVTAENGQRNRYTVSYTMVQSSVSTLQMIYVNAVDSLPGFQPYTTEYIYTLPAGTEQAPLVVAIEGDPYQTIEQAELTEPTATDALSATIFTVNAQDGSKRIYTITFVVAPDTTTTLNMITYNGHEIPRYDDQIMEYTIQLSKDESMLPFIAYSKYNEKQMVDVVVTDSNQVQIIVTAADGITKGMYQLTFLPYLSSNGQLDAIYLNDTLFTQFKSDQDSYEMTIDSLNNVPEITCDLAEEAQQVIVVTNEVKNDQDKVYDVVKTIKVIPENRTDTSFYVITFHIKENTPLRPEESDNTNLLAIYIHGQLIGTELGFDQDFNMAARDYRKVYPIGENPDLFYTHSDVTCIVQDSLAQISAINQETLKTALDSAGHDVVVATCIHITVMAACGKIDTYNIYQTLELDSLNRTTELLVTDYQGILRSIPNFDKDVLYYEYILSDTRNNAPPFELHYSNTHSRFACVNFERGNDFHVVDADDDTNYAMVEGEHDPTYHISYRAENGTTFVYKIKFRRSEIKRALKPMEGDVLIQHIPGSTQLAVASLRANVVFSLYNMAGQMVESVKLEEGDPNNFITTTDGYNQTIFGHLTDFSSCTIINVQSNQLYFWCFTENNKRKIKSGKIIIVP